MFASGLFYPELIINGFFVIFWLVVIGVLVRKLSRVDQETNRPYNRTLRRFMWGGFVTCSLVLLVNTVVRIWYEVTAQAARGGTFPDKFWVQVQWIIFTIAAVSTAVLAVYLRRADRPFPLGHCKRCGYDLQGNVSGVCPECGKPEQSITRAKTLPSGDGNRETVPADGEPS